MKSLIKYIALFSFIVLSKFGFSTAQYGDILIVDKDTSWINSNPLEEYFDKKGARTIGDKSFDNILKCSALWRGYVATWKLENDSLFLVRLQSDYCTKPNEIDLNPEFGTNRVFASWVSSSLLRPEGNMLQYIHAGYMSIFEAMTYLKFKRGILKNTTTENYLEKNSERVYPGKHYLTDTIRTIILKEIDLEERTSLPDSGGCFLVVQFDEKGFIDSMSIGITPSTEDLNTLELLVLNNAQKALEHFPPLMLVRHPNYRPVRIELFFGVHCLKNPYDRAYGCRYE